MTNITNARAEWTADFFAERFADLPQVSLCVVDPDDWATLANEPQAVPHLHPLGFWPVAHRPGTEHPLLLAFSPAVIAAAGAWLDSDDFEDFLRTVIVLIQHALGFIDSGMSELEQIRAAEDELHRDAPDALNLLSAVHMRLLDQS